MLVVHTEQHCSHSIKSCSSVTTVHQNWQNSNDDSKLKDLIFQGYCKAENVKQTNENVRKKIHYILHAGANDLLGNYLTFSSHLTDKSIIRKANREGYDAK